MLTIAILVSAIALGGTDTVYASANGKEINYYKIGILIGGNYYEENINMRAVYYTDKKIIQEENKAMSIEYDLKSPFVSLECNFDNVNKYIEEEEFVAMRSHAKIYPLDMLFGEMTFTPMAGWSKVMTQEVLDELGDKIVLPN